MDLGLVVEATEESRELPWEQEATQHFGGNYIIYTILAISLMLGEIWSNELIRNLLIWFDKAST